MSKHLKYATNINRVKCILVHTLKYNILLVLTKKKIMLFIVSFFTHSNREYSIVIPCKLNVLYNIVLYVFTNNVYLHLKKNNFSDSICMTCTLEFHS